MKITPRIHRNGASKRTISQVKTQRAKPNKAKAVQEPVGMMFFAEESGNIGNGVDLDPAEFVAIKKDAAARRESLDAWLIRTLDETPALRAIRSTSPAEKQVRIVVVDDEGEPITVFGILESQHQAMEANAESKGISLQQWMKNAVGAKLLNGRSQLPPMPPPEVLEQRRIAESMERSVIKADALFTLLERNTDQGDRFADEKRQQDFDFGIAMLMQHVSEGFRNNAASIIAAAYPQEQKAEVAA